MSFSGNLIKRGLLLLVAVTLTVTGVSAEEFESSIEYHATAPLGDWVGKNRAQKGSINVTAGSGKVCVKMADWDSGNVKRDRHTDELFETDRYPLACYNLTSVKQSNNSVTVKGDLTIRNVTRPVSFQGSFTDNNSSRTFVGSARVKLTNFGLTPPSMMGISVDDEIEIKVISREVK